MRGSIFQPIHLMIPLGVILEDWILSQERSRDSKGSVFTGPIFQESDPMYQGVSLSRETEASGIMSWLRTTGFVAHSTVDNGVLSAAEISAQHNTTLANIGRFGPRVTLTKAAEVRFEAQP